MSQKRGKFIVFEGLDGSGKTTQSKKLVETGFLGKTEYIVFPDRSTQIGQIIDSFLKNKTKQNDQVIHLLYSANRWETVEKINNLLDNGINIICDRYCYSGIAYTHSKGIDLDWCISPEKGLPKPDLVLFLEIDPEVQSKRKGFGDEVYEKAEFQKKVRESYNKIKSDDWIFIDANGTRDEVTEKIKNVLSEKLLE